MGQRLLGLFTIVFILAIALGGHARRKALAERREAVPSLPSQPAEGAPAREITLRPHPDATAPERGTPSIDMLAALTVRRRLLREGSRVYIDALLRETDSVVVRWPDRASRTYSVRYVADTSLKGWSPDLIGDARAGFQAWSSNGAGISFQETTDSVADITVEWMRSSGNPNEAGSTSLTWGSDGAITQAAVHLAIALNDSTPLTASDRQRTAAHEVGHALGLPHSTEPEDLLFWKSEVTQPSRRDLATLLLLYTVPPGPLKVSN